MASFRVKRIITKLEQKFEEIPLAKFDKPNLIASPPGFLLWINRDATKAGRLLQRKERRLVQRPPSPYPTATLPINHCNRSRDSSYPNTPNTPKNTAPQSMEASLFLVPGTLPNKQTYLFSPKNQVYQLAMPF